MQTKLYSALCTPMTEDYKLHLEGFQTHINQQIENQIYGLLINGSMGSMQLLPDNVYKDAVKYGVLFAHNKAEVLVGVGDTSFPRTMDKIRYVEEFDIDGIVVLAPYVIKFSQEELYDYFTAIANTSKKPVYLYDIPGFAGVKIENDTMLKLSSHHNIIGAKCSDSWERTRVLMDIVDDDFKIIPAQPCLIDQLIYMEIEYNLDGVYSVCPELASAIVVAAERGDYKAAALLQKDLSEFLYMIKTQFPSRDAFSAILNARGVQGKISIPPMKIMTFEERCLFLENNLIKKVLSYRQVSDCVLI